MTGKDDCQDVWEDWDKAMDEIDRSIGIIEECDRQVAAMDALPAHRCGVGVIL